MVKVEEKNILLLKKVILSKCIKDPNFKKQFLENPKTALEKAFQVQLPSEMQIKALEENDSLLYVVVPSKNVIESGELENEFELSDEELKAIAGGGGDEIKLTLGGEEVDIVGLMGDMLGVARPGQKGKSG